MPVIFKPIFIGEELFGAVADLIGWARHQSRGLSRDELFSILKDGYNLVVIQENILNFDLTSEMRAIDENYPEVNILLLPTEKSEYSTKLLRYLSERAVGVDLSNK